MTLLLAASLSGIPWSGICLIISLIFLFIAAFVVDGVGVARPRIHFLSAGIFFYVLAVAIS